MDLFKHAVIFLGIKYIFGECLRARNDGFVWQSPGFYERKHNRLDFFFNLAQAGARQNSQV